MNSLITKLGALALFSILSLGFRTAAAQDAPTCAGHPPACGTLTQVTGGEVLMSAQSCQCSGTVNLEVVGGELTIKPSTLVCYTHRINASYPGFKSGGDTLLQCSHWVNDQIRAQNCNTSDCSWFFGWWGTPQCDDKISNLASGGFAYFAVGTCKDGKPVGTASDNSSPKGE